MNEDLFLSRGLLVIVISGAAVNLKNYFMILNSQEMRILSEPQRDVKKTKKCLIDLHNYGYNEGGLNYIENVLPKYAHIFAKDEYGVGFRVRVKHEMHLT